MRGEAADPRRAAWRVLRDVAGGAFADRAAEARFAGLDERDRSLATELAYGAIRLRGRLDHELEAFVDRPLERVDGGALDWLRLGLYQIRETRVPGHAAVDEAVEGARGTGGERATGFVNAVLRSALRHGDRAALFPAPGDDPRAHLIAWGSHPAWLVDRWLERLPVDDVVRLVEHDNRPPPVTVRLPPGTSLPSGGEVGPGVRLEPLPGWPRCAALVEGRPADLLRAVPGAVVQDPAAAAVVDYVGGLPAGPSLDACAAPGGKAVALAATSQGGRPFVAADLDRGRLARVAEAAERADVDVRCVAMDAARPAVAEAGFVLLDAPCTGTGTLRRRPDARWRAGPDRLGALVSLQARLLEGCAAIVRPGGLLVYATCSLEAEENEDQVEGFLSRHPEFEREPPASPTRDDLLDERGDLAVRPWSHGTDGAYAARLRRRAT